jgi:hypothetical protein
MKLTNSLGGEMAIFLFKEERKSEKGELRDCLIKLKLHESVSLCVFTEKEDKQIFGQSQIVDEERFIGRRKGRHLEEFKNLVCTRTHLIKRVGRYVAMGIFFPFE